MPDTDPPDSRPIQRERDIGTLGRLAAAGYKLGGYCLDCRRLFGIVLEDLIAERGADCVIKTMAPLQCPICQGSRTEKSIYWHDPRWTNQPVYTTAPRKTGGNS